MTLSSLTSISDIPDNSYATPGLWNSRYSIINQDFRQLNSDVSAFSALTKITYAMLPVGSGAWDTNAGTTLTLTRALTLTNGPLTVSLGGITVTAGGLTVAAGTSAVQALTATTISLSGALTFTAAASQIVPGATSISLRNTANGADNLLITDTGAITVRSTISGVTTLTATTLAGALSTAAQPSVTSLGTLTALTISGALTFTAATSQIVPGATSISLRNTSNGSDNLLVTDAGKVTIRDRLLTGGATATTNSVAGDTIRPYNTGARSVSQAGTGTYEDFARRTIGGVADTVNLNADAGPVYVGYPYPTTLNASAYEFVMVNAKYFRLMNAAVTTSYRGMGLNASDQLSVDADARGTIFGGVVGVGGYPATSCTLDVQGTTGALMIPRLTTTQKNALTAADGMIIYDSTLAKFQGREAGAWNNFSVL